MSIVAELSYVDWGIAIAMPLVVLALTGIVAVLAYMYRRIESHGERLTAIEAKQVSRHDFANLQQTVATLVAVQGVMVKQNERMEVKLDRLLEALP